MATHEPEPLTLTVPEAGRLLGLGRTAAYEAARAGEIPTLKIRGKLLVPRKRLMELLDGEPIAPASPTAREPALLSRAR